MGDLQVPAREDLQVPPAIRQGWGRRDWGRQGWGRRDWGHRRRNRRAPLRWVRGRHVRGTGRRVRRRRVTGQWARTTHRRVGGRRARSARQRRPRAPGRLAPPWWVPGQFWPGGLARGQSGGGPIRWKPGRRLRQPSRLSTPARPAPPAAVPGTPPAPRSGGAAPRPHPAPPDPWAGRPWPKPMSTASSWPPPGHIGPPRFPEEPPLHLSLSWASQAPGRARPSRRPDPGERGHDGQRPPCHRQFGPLPVRLSHELLPFVYSSATPDEADANHQRPRCGGSDESGWERARNRDRYGHGVSSSGGGMMSPGLMDGPR